MAGCANIGYFVTFGQFIYHVWCRSHTCYSKLISLTGHFGMEDGRSFFFFFVDHYITNIRDVSEALSFNHRIRGTCLSQGRFSFFTLSKYIYHGSHHVTCFT